MYEVLAAALFTAALAGVVTSVLVPAVIRVATFLRIFDQPGGRKTQSKAVPRLGGVAIFCGLALASSAVILVRWNAWSFGLSRSELAALAVGTLLVFLVGLVDDVVGASVLHRLLVETLAAALLVALGWSFQVLSLPGFSPISLGVFGELVTIVWIVGVTNAINLIDGLDGLAGGVVAIVATGLLIYSVVLGNPLAVVLMAAMAGACVGFLRHNWAPAKIFMGDSGSLTLGFLLAALSVQSTLKAPAAVAILVPILALGLPVIDTLAVMFVRFLDRPHGKLLERFLRMFVADRNHLHHMLEPFVAQRGRIVGAIYLVVLTFCALALVVAVTHNAALGLALVVLEVAAVLVLRNLGPVFGRRNGSGEGHVVPLEAPQRKTGT